MNRFFLLAVLAFAVTSPGAMAEDARFGPADPIVKDATELETTIFDPRTFEGSPYSWDGDWTNASVPAVAYDLKSMGFSLVGRARDHRPDRETDRAVRAAGTRAPP